MGSGPGRRRSIELAGWRAGTVPLLTSAVSLLTSGRRYGNPILSTRTEMATPRDVHLVPKRVLPVSMKLPRAETFVPNPGLYLAQDR